MSNCLSKYEQDSSYAANYYMTNTHQQNNNNVSMYIPPIQTDKIQGDVSSINSPYRTLNNMNDCYKNQFIKNMSVNDLYSPFIRTKLPDAKRNEYCTNENWMTPLIETKNIDQLNHLTLHHAPIPLNSRDIIRTVYSNST